MNSLSNASHIFAENDEFIFVNCRPHDLNSISRTKFIFVGVGLWTPS